MADGTVYLFDVDNTLLDNDAVADDLRSYLTDTFGEKRQQRYWVEFEQLRDELGYENDLPYEILSGPVNEAWSYKEFEGRSVSVVSRLAETMRANPHLRLHVACGYHDGATPYFAAEHVIAPLPIPSALQANIEFRYYEAGHMMYIHEPSRLRQANDLADLLTRPSAGWPSTVAIPPRVASRRQ